MNTSVLSVKFEIKVVPQSDVERQSSRRIGNTYLQALRFVSNAHININTNIITNIIIKLNTNTNIIINIIIYELYQQHQHQHQQHETDLSRLFLFLRTVTEIQTKEATVIEQRAL